MGAGDGVAVTVTIGARVLSAVALAEPTAAPAMASSRGAGRVWVDHEDPSHQRTADGSVGSAYHPASGLTLAPVPLVATSSLCLSVGSRGN